jgi:hypothetical protein
MGAWALFAQEQGLNNIQDRENFVDNPSFVAIFRLWIAIAAQQLAVFCLACAKQGQHGWGVGCHNYSLYLILIDSSNSKARCFCA